MANPLLEVGQNPPPLRSPFIDVRPAIGSRKTEIVDELASVEMLVSPAWAKFFALLVEQIGGGSTVTAAPYVITFASTITPDYSNGSIQEVTLTGDITINFPTNAVAGGSFLLVWAQDATGGWEITLDPGYKLGEELAFGDPSTVTALGGYFMSATELRVTIFRQGDPV